MKILFVTENLYPDVMGGSGRVVEETTKRLAAGGHKVNILCRQAGVLPLQSESKGVAIRRYPAGANPFSTLKSISRALQSMPPPDIIIVCQPFPALSVLALPSFRSIPKVRDFYGPWHEEYRTKRLGLAHPPSSVRISIGAAIRRQVDVRTMTRMTGIRVLSEYTADMIRAMSPSCAGRISLIPAGVDTDRFKPAGDKMAMRRQTGLPENRPILFTVRNLTPRMGLDRLIDAMPAVRTAAPQALLIIGGEGPLRPVLESQIQRLGLEGQVRLAGRIPDDQLSKYYQAADLFVLPTLQLEGFGLVTLEAMACGTPVLATPQGGTMEILRPFAAECLFNDVTATAMAEKIIHALA
ncbi:MAG: glycosyltransferase family 4 protein, partial [Lentisphaerota bacterium]